MRGLTRLGLGLGVAAVAACAWRGAERVVVTGDSMVPTLRAGDRLVVVRRSRPRVGALVVVGDPRDPRRRVVKRLAASGADGAVVLGDNPPASTDSRTWGTVPWRLVHGVAVYRYAPADRAGRIGDGRPPREPAVS